MDEPFAALDALTRRKMQDELLQLWDDTRFTVLFVTHSIAEAMLIGNRILLLSPHPGQVKAELNSDGSDPVDAGSGAQAVRPHPRHAVRRSHRGSRAVDTAIAHVDRHDAQRRMRPEYVPRATVAERRLRRRATKPLSSASGSGKQALAAQGCSSSWCSPSVWQAYAPLPQQPAAVPDLRGDASRRSGERVASGDAARADAGRRCRCCCMGYAARARCSPPCFTDARRSTSRIGTDLLETLTAMFNPLPAIALLPLALIWFGLGDDEPRLRARPFGAVGGRAQHPLGLPVGVATRCAWSGATTACAGSRYVAQDPDPGGLPVAS